MREGMTNLAARGKGEQTATFKLYEVGRGYPDLLVASVTAPYDRALAEISHYATVYGQDGPVRIEEVEEDPQ